MTSDQIMFYAADKRGMLDLSNPNPSKHNFHDRETARNVARLIADGILEMRETTIADAPSCQEHFLCQDKTHGTKSTTLRHYFLTPKGREVWLRGGR